MPLKLPNFLPGRLALSRGAPRDYLELEDFHYLPKRPATWADVWTIRYHPANSQDSRIIAIGVLSYCSAGCRIRDRFFQRQQFSRIENLKFVNKNIRTISRVIVHPQFRSLGLSTILVRCLCDHCPTRYVEALAQMGRAHPFFERAGMTRIEPDDPDEPIYFIFDRTGDEL